MTFKLHNDPIPQTRGRPVGTTKYPWANMKVGNGFYVPLEDAVKTPIRLRTAARAWAKYNDQDWKFTVRVKGSQVGIWRIR